MKLDEVEKTYILTWNGNEGVGLLARGIHKPEWQSLTRGVGWIIGELVGPVILVKAFYAMFGKYSDNRFTAKDAKTGEVLFDAVRMTLDGDEDTCAAGEMAVISRVGFRVYQD